MAKISGQDQQKEILIMPWLKWTRNTQSANHTPHIMMHLNIKEGIKNFGDKGNNALQKELNQLHKWQTLSPRKREDMPYDEKKPWDI